MKPEKLCDLLPKPSLRHLVVVSDRRIMQLRHVVDQFRVLKIEIDRSPMWSEETRNRLSGDDASKKPKWNDKAPKPEALNGRKRALNMSDPSGKLLSAKRAGDGDLRIQAWVLSGKSSLEFKA